MIRWPDRPNALLYTKRSGRLNWAVSGKEYSEAVEDVFLLSIEQAPNEARANGSTAMVGRSGQEGDMQVREDRSTGWQLRIR